jgi:hemoglobin-like flavoprotein
MTEAQKTLVRRTWEKVLPTADRYTDAMYEEFFTAEPQLRLLFDTPMDVQHVKLINIITDVIDAFDDGTRSARMLTELGQRHVDYSVDPRHFRVMRPAFVKALDRTLSEGATAEVLDAWGAFYDHMVAAMGWEDGPPVANDHDR